MSLYTKNGTFPKPIPFRIVLSNGKTRTDPSTFTAEEIADAGFVEVSDEPVYDSLTENLEWNNQTLDWSKTNKTQSELATNLNRLKNGAKEEILAARNEKLKLPFYSNDVGDLISRDTEDMVFTLTSIITSMLSTREGASINVPIIDVNDRIVLLDDQAVVNVTTQLFRANRSDFIEYRNVISNLRGANTAAEISNIVSTYTVG